jgi:DNA-binding LacI/PurR family transcriptional regulator
MSDQLALGVMAAAATRRIRVPAGLSVVGFDDIPEAAGAGLTTIHQPHQAKGAAAARLLLDPAGVAGQAIRLPVQRVLRASTAPPPA